MKKLDQKHTCIQIADAARVRRSFMENKKNKPVLVIMAAGMGSRYGGLKQIDPVGPNGEVIIEYSLYDAMKAGFPL